MDQNQLQKAQTAATAEELLAMAQAEGYPMTEEEAASVFAMLHPAAGELSDAELENVSGGGCGDPATVTIGSHKYMVVTSHYSCYCYSQGASREYLAEHDNASKRLVWYDCSAYGKCGRCEHLEFKGSTGICGYPVQ